MRIQNKLFVTFLLAGIPLVVLMFVAIQWSLTRGLLEFINTKERDRVVPLVEVLKERYQRQGNWRWIDGRHKLFHDLFRDYVVKNDEESPPPRRRPPPRHNGDDFHRPQGDRPQNDGPPTLNDPQQRNGQGQRPPRRERPTDLALYDQQKKLLVGNPNREPSDFWQAISIDEQIIGYLVFPKHDGITKGYELTLLQQQRFAYIVITLGLIGLMVITALPLARNLVRPIKQLAGSMDQLTKGNYQSRVDIDRNDELGELGRDVNELAMTLGRNETARKRWLANISHELRTPIAVLKSEMEAVIDGVRPLDLQQVQSSHQEVQRLQRLVEDLYELSSADIGGLKYRKEQFDLVEMLQDEVPQWQQILANANIHLSCTLPERHYLVWADADRLCQLFNNIVVNCSKYVGEKGIVNLSVQRQKQQIQIRIEDNGPGVENAHLSNLFEHLYRVENSRNRETGGSGLGLAICKQIVEAHQGKVWAEQSTLGGLAVIIELPLLKRKG